MIEIDWENFDPEYLSERLHRMYDEVLRCSWPEVKLIHYIAERTKQTPEVLVDMKKWSRKWDDETLPRLSE